MTREDLGRGVAYTQWEAWLALGFGKYGPSATGPEVAPATRVERTGRNVVEDLRASQTEHLRRLGRSMSIPPIRFTKRRQSRQRGPRLGCPRRLKEGGGGTKGEAPQPSLHLDPQPVRRPR